MNEPAAILQELTVDADLNRIIKYHPASGVYLNDLTKNKYSASVSVKLLIENVNGVHQIAPDYQFAKIIDEQLPASGHDLNLLVLVNNLLQLEWGYYMTYYVLDDTEKATINLHAHVTKQLEELKVLVSILEQGKAADVTGKIQLTEMRTVDRRKKRYNVPGMQVLFSTESECVAVIGLLARLRIQELSKPEYFYYNFKHESFKDYTTVLIQKAIDRMRQPFRDFRAKWLFCKLVCEKVLAYMKGEMDWNQGDIDVTESQGVIIHTLLVLFNLVPPDQELMNNTKRLKAKYVRTFFRKDLADNEEAFHNFVKVSEGPELTEKQKCWFKVI